MPDRVVGVIVVALALMQLAATAQAEHIIEYTGFQAAAAPGGTVTLAFLLATGGQPTGGNLVWWTGDGAWGVLSDGFVEGLAPAFASGEGMLSDGRPFSWTVSTGQANTWVHPVPHPGAAVLTVTYAYPRSGVYVVLWSTCCEQEDGRLHVVALGNEPPESVPRLVPNCQWIDDDFAKCMLSWRGSIETPSTGVTP